MIIHVTFRGVLSLSVEPSEPPTGAAALLMGFEGTDASTSHTDESGTVRAFSTMGSAAITTAQQKFGASSLSVPLDSCIYTADVANLVVGESPFTVECWVRYQSVDFEQCAVSYGDQSYVAWSIISNSGSLQVNLTGSDLGGTFIVGPALDADVWTHVAFARDSDGWVRGFKDGVLFGSEFFPGELYVPPDPRLVIGAVNEFGTLAWGGEIDELRVTVGEALYTGNFTPPSAAFPRP